MTPWRIRPAASEKCKSQKSALRGYLDLRWPCGAKFLVGEAPRRKIFGKLGPEEVSGSNGAKIRFRIGRVQKLERFKDGYRKNPNFPTTYQVLKVQSKSGSTDYGCVPSSFCFSTVIRSPGACSEFSGARWVPFPKFPLTSSFLKVMICSNSDGRSLSAK